MKNTQTPQAAFFKDAGTKDRNKRRDEPRSWIVRLNAVESSIPSSFQLVFRFNTIFIKIPVKFFANTAELFLN